MVRGDVHSDSFYLISFSQADDEFALAGGDLEHLCARFQAQQGNELINFLNIRRVAEHVFAMCDVKELPLVYFQSPVTELGSQYYYTSQHIKFHPPSLE